MVKVLVAARGKSPPGLFPGLKTSGFHGCCAPGIASLRSSRPLLHGLVAALAALASGLACAGTYNPDRAIGDVVPAWSDLPGTDGRRHAWADLADRDLVVVVFTCNSCPYAVDYEDRINALARRLAGPESRAALVAINCNLLPADSPAAMRERAMAKDFRFPYLFDESQRVARSFGAVRTPEFFVIDKGRRILYMGAMDDDATGAKVMRHHLDDALAAAIAGRPIAVAETAPVGCLIRYARRRDAR